MCIGSKLQGSRCGRRMPHRCTACTLRSPHRSAKGLRMFSPQRSPQRPLRILGWLDGRVLWAPNPKQEKWVWTCDLAFSCCMCISFSTSVCVSGICWEEKMCAKKRFVNLRLLLTLHFVLNVYKEFWTCLDIACVCSVSWVFSQVLGSVL